MGRGLRCLLRAVRRKATTAPHNAHRSVSGSPHSTTDPSAAGVIQRDGLTWTKHVLASGCIWPGRNRVVGSARASVDFVCWSEERPHSGWARSKPAPQSILLTDPKVPKLNGHFTHQFCLRSGGFAGFQNLGRFPLSDMSYACTSRWPPRA